MKDKSDLLIDTGAVQGGRIEIPWPRHLSASATPSVTMNCHVLFSLLVEGLIAPFGCLLSR